MSRMDDDLFTYEVEIPGLSSIPCNLNNEDDSERQMTQGSDVYMEYDPSNVEFIEWLASKFYNHKTMDHIQRMHYGFIGLKAMMKLDSPTKNPLILMMKMQLLKSLGSTLIWKDDEYCNEGNFFGAYIVGNTLCYQDLEWYETLKDNTLKKEALKNKAIMEGIIDEDDESSNEGWRRWDNYENTNRDHEERKYQMEHEDEERCELFDNPHQEASVCKIRRFEMIMYLFGEDED
nr:hypothetical protein [Tanacetum cinerariifolium]